MSGENLKIPSGQNSKGASAAKPAFQAEQPPDNAGPDLAFE
jgi:hypothetical protein